MVNNKFAWVPIAVPNKRYRNRPNGGVFAGIILLFIFGFLFFVIFNRFNGFSVPIFFMIGGFSIFLIIISVIIAVAASMSSTYKKPKEEYVKSYQYQPQNQTNQSNPYIIRNSIPEEYINKEIKGEISVVSEINYCRYCGSKIDRDAVYCHMCGTKL
ncbi:MAG: zinc-ribbon domain-containing protein [Candidatus Heimdallarchaeota archaeon]